MVKKLLKKSSKKNVSRKTTHKSKRNNKRKLVKNMKGGDAGRYVMPPSYYGSGTSGYFPEGSPELETASNQHAVSQGMVWDNGKYAGPNLYPTMTGSGLSSGCGCSRKYKTHNKKNKTSKKSKLHTKSKKHTKNKVSKQH